MNVVDRSNSISAFTDRFVPIGRPRRCALNAAIVLVSVFMLCESATAQYYRGYRYRGPVVIAPPILPSPYYGVPWGPPPVMVGPPSSVRIQTPFFSMNMGPSAVVVPDYPISSFRYESYRPRYEYGYSYSTPGRYGAVPRPAVPQSFGSQSVETGRYGQYRASNDGGIPELTVPPTDSLSRYPRGGFSLTALRQAAELLRGSLQRRPVDADVWLDYLQPDTIIADIVAGQPSESIAVLSDRYQGVTQNPDLVAIMRLPGFNQIRQQLPLWLEIDGIVAAQSSRSAASSAENVPQQDQPADDDQEIAAPALEEILPGPRDTGDGT